MRPLRLVTLLLALSACSPDDDRRRCNVTGDCQRDEACLHDGYCGPPEVRPCATDEDCGKDGVCLEAVCAGGTACQRSADCRAGESCNLVTRTCEVARCDESSRCPNNGFCDFSTNRCGRARGCVKDSDCSAPDGLCEEGFCVPGCSKTGCAAGQSCQPATGRCGSGGGGGGCTHDSECPFSSPVCQQGTCVAACTPGSCPGSLVCNTDTGRCETGGGGGCSTDAECNVPSTICEQGKCIAGCTEGSCPGTLTCNTDTGRCVSGIACTIDAECAPPVTLCENGECVPGCSGTGCPEWESCSEFTGRCEPKFCGTDADCGPPLARCEGDVCVPGCAAPGQSCPPNRPCDQTSGRCGGATLPLDAPCASNDECESNFCLTPNSTENIPGVCSMTCGATVDCPAGRKCASVPSSKGVKACVPSTGSKQATQACNTGAECRSGICFGNPGDMYCFDACSNDMLCGDGFCRAWTDGAGGHTQMCMADAFPSIRDEFPAQCSIQCASFLCTPTAQCFEPCCTSNDCGAGNLCLSFYPYDSETLLQSATPMKGCLPAAEFGYPPLGMDPVGASCLLSDGSNCRSGLCVGTKSDGTNLPPNQGYCSDACCTDADCGPGYACNAAYDEGLGYAFHVCLKL